MLCVCVCLSFVVCCALSACVCVLSVVSVLCFSDVRFSVSVLRFVCVVCRFCAFCVVVCVFV